MPKSFKESSMSVTPQPEPSIKPVKDMGLSVSMMGGGPVSPGSPMNPQNGRILGSAPDGKGPNTMPSKGSGRDKSRKSPPGL